MKPDLAKCHKKSGKLISTFFYVVAILFSKTSQISPLQGTKLEQLILLKKYKVICRLLKWKE